MTEWLHFRFSLSCIGEGNGNPLQYSCLENPRDGGAWWAAVYGVTQSRTRLKRLSSRRPNRASLVAQVVKNLPAMRETWIQSLGWEDWRRAQQPTPVFVPGESPWTEKPGGLQSMGLQRVRHDWATKHSTAPQKWSYWDQTGVNSSPDIVTSHLCDPGEGKLLFRASVSSSAKEVRKVPTS